MQSEDPTMSAEDSLRIITSMIAQVKGNLKQNSFYFLLWGWVIALINMGVYLLLKFEVAHPYRIWLITIPAFILSIVYGYRQENRAGVTTHFDRLSAGIWISFSVTIAIVIAFGKAVNWQIPALVLVIMAAPTLITGLLLRFTPLLVGGAAFWVGGILCFIIKGETQFLISAIVIIIGYLLPGYLLQKR
ncbi:hypothetical protein [Spirosoma sp. KNUC1025]|uniref:hypothetical protein n=1 Tax=Spirosoma sp. KNUC1025 TaxID=2894082 RepID=UPI0038631CFB|nr:hypothetical protein LN737_11320 [Spirosoma sp. KNUC1025]